MKKDRFNHKEVIISSISTLYLTYQHFSNLVAHLLRKMGVALSFCQDMDIQNVSPFKVYQPTPSYILSHGTLTEQYNQGYSYSSTSKTNRDAKHDMKNTSLLFFFGLC